MESNHLLLLGRQTLNQLTKEAYLPNQKYENDNQDAGGGAVRFHYQ